MDVLSCKEDGSPLFQLSSNKTRTSLLGDIHHVRIAVNIDPFDPCNKCVRLYINTTMNITNYLTLSPVKEKIVLEMLATINPSVII